VLNLVLKFVPTVVTAVMMTTAMSETINPYSMAVAPVLFARKAQMNLVMPLQVTRTVNGQ
jgi:hypothetical protein